MKELIEIQNELKAPKNQFNKFGNYNYRSCEDILEAVKPLCKKHGCLLLISDEIIEVGGRVYVQAEAAIKKDSDVISVKAFARESENKKGMDDSQITGSASSYARKYALNGLFLIDDTKDSDSTNDHSKKDDEKPKENAVTIWMTKDIFEGYKSNLDACLFKDDLTPIISELKEWKTAPKGMKKEYYAELTEIVKQKQNELN